MGLSAAITTGVEALGAGAATAGTIGAVAAPALYGAAGGAGLSALTGGNIGKGALEGGLTGGGIGLGGEFLAPELGGTLGGALGGAAGGAAGAGVTGQNIGTGALTGGISGGIAGSLSPTTSTASTSGAAPAGATAAPSGGGAPGLPAAPTPVDTSQSLPWLTNNATTSGNVGSLSPQSLGTSASSFGGEQIGTPTAANTGTSLGNVAGNINIAPAGGATINPGTAGGGYDLAGNFAGGTGSAVTGGGAGAPSSGGFLSGLGDKAIESITKDPLGVGVAGLGLAGDIIKGNQSIKGERQIQAEAGQLANQGAKLGNYLETGTLPPGLQTALNQAADAMKARIQSKYASMGLEGSSAMQQELANVDMQTQGAAAQEALNLLNQGVNETGMASQLYQFMINNTLQQDQQLAQGFANFGAAASGQPQGINPYQLLAGRATQ